MPNEPVSQNKEITDAEIQAYVEERKGLERDYLKEILLSRKRAWRVALGFGVLAGLSIATLATVFPLKESFPWILKVDSATGAVESLSLVQPESTSYGDVIDTYWLGRYINARESYNYYAIQEYYDKTMLFSDDITGTEYDSLFVGDEALDKKFKDTIEITANAVSVDINPLKNDAGDSLATVRFNKSILRANTKKSTLVPYVATISYKYTGGVMSAKDRFVNPLGFKVTSYRAVPEVVK